MTYKKVNRNIQFGHALTESGLNRLVANLNHGAVILSGNISSLPSDMDSSIWAEYDKYLDENDLDDSKSNRDEFLTNRNARADKQLEKDIQARKYSYSKVFGGYHGTNDVKDSYEPSFVVYTKDRSGNDTDFDELFDFAVAMCKKYCQDSVYIQEPGRKPFYVDCNGVQISHPGPNSFKFNRDSETFFTTTKRKKDHPDKFTADIQFDESLRIAHPTSVADRMRRTQLGEVIL